MDEKQILFLTALATRVCFSFNISNGKELRYLDGVLISPEFSPTSWGTPERMEVAIAGLSLALQETTDDLSLKFLQTGGVHCTNPTSGDIPESREAAIVGLSLELQGTTDDLSELQTG